MIYTQIVISTTTLGSEIVSDLLYTITDIGACVFDRADLKIPTWDYAEADFDKNFFDREVVVKGFCIQSDTQRVLENLKTELSYYKTSDLDLGSLEIFICEVDDENWLNAWKKYFQVQKISNIVICPQWIDYSAANGEVVLKIDPGLAFGTGEHETTKMCIELMQTLPLNSAKVFDVGCGSGILGIAALLLGAKKCLFADYDEQAVTATNQNISLNNLVKNAKVIQNDLANCINDKFDLVLANLTADLLARLFPQLNKVIENGYAILSGIIDTKLSFILDLCHTHNLQVLSQLQYGCWCAVLARVQNG